MKERPFKEGDKVIFTETGEEVTYVGRGEVKGTDFDFFRFEYGCFFFSIYEVVEKFKKKE